MTFSDPGHLIIGKYGPGDWIVLCVPELSPFEWHPFSISSACDGSDVITLTIKDMGPGTWTGKLRRLVDTIKASRSSRSDADDEDSTAPNETQPKVSANRFDERFLAAPKPLAARDILKDSSGFPSVFMHGP